MKWHVVIIHPDNTSDTYDFETEKEANDFFKDKLIDHESHDRGYIYQS